MSAADTLRQAAARIEQIAAAASPSPWAAVESYPEAWAVTSPGGGYLANESSYGALATADARWIAMLGPQIAGPLAAWLRAEAKASEDRITLRIPSLGVTGPALALARAILGEAP